jgi:hypothetical protein
MNAGSCFRFRSRRAFFLAVFSVEARERGRGVPGASHAFFEKKRPHGLLFSVRAVYCIVAL